MIIVGLPKTFYAASGTSHSFDKPIDLQVGDILIAHLRCQESTWTADWIPPSSWVRYGPAFVPSLSTRRVTSVFVKIITDPTSEPTNYTFIANGTTSRRQGDLWVIRGGSYVEAAGGSYGGSGIANGVKTPVFTPINHNSEPGLSIFFADSEFGSPNNHVPSSTPSGFTVLFSAVNPSAVTTTSRTYTWIGTKDHVAGETIPEASISWAGTPAGPSAVLLNIQAAVESPPVSTLQVELGNASLADVWLYDGSQEKAVSQILVIPRSKREFSVSDMDVMIANSEPVYWAHRGGSIDWSEMTMRAYTNSVWHGMRVLEVSCMQSLDGVWLMSHDTNLSRVTGQNLEIATTQASSLIGLAVTVPTTGGVIGTLAELIDAYPKIILMLDRKARGNAADFLAMAQSVPNATEHVIIKFDGQWDRTFAATARAVGFKTAGYVWDTNIAHLAAAAAVSDYIGLNWDASQTDWDSALAYNKPVWGHVCQTLVQAQTAITKGAKIIQCAGVKAIVPGINTIA